MKVGRREFGESQGGEIFGIRNAEERRSRKTYTR